MLARATLESLLRERQLDRTLAAFSGLKDQKTPAEQCLATGHPRTDAALGGGWPRGALSVLSGAASAGRTTTLLQTMGSVTREGELAALIDAADRFDPEPAASRGVVLDRVLWVRGTVSDSARIVPVPGGSAGHRVAARPITQAVRAFDLVLRAGGFGLVVLDLCGVPARVIKGLPFTTWLRLARAVEHSRTVAMVMADPGAAPAPGPGGVALMLAASPARWRGASALSRVFDGPSLAPRVTGFRKVLPVPEVPEVLS